MDSPDLCHVPTNAFGSARAKVYEFSLVCQNISIEDEFLGGSELIAINRQELPTEHLTDFVEPRNVQIDVSKTVKDSAGRDLIGINRGGVFKLYS